MRNARRVTLQKNYFCEVVWLLQNRKLKKCLEKTHSVLSLIVSQKKRTKNEFDCSCG